MHLYKEGVRNHLAAQQHVKFFFPSLHYHIFKNKIKEAKKTIQVQ